MSQVLLASYGAAVTPITPSDLAGLILWLDADAQSFSDNDPVGTWVDSSGSGNDAVQATGGSKPVFKTGIINGLPVVRFDGTDDFMMVSSLAKGLWTIFYVYNASVGGILAEHSVNGGTNDGDYHYIPGGAHFAARGNSSLSAYDISAPSLSTGTWRYISRQQDGVNAGHLAWVNGVAATIGSVTSLGNPTSAVVTADYYIGARAGSSLFSAVDIAEIIVYDNVLASSNRQGIEAYLADKYAI